MRATGVPARPMLRCHTALATDRDGAGLVEATVGLDIRASVRSNLPLVVTYQEDEVWGALGDGTRRAIVLRLADGPQAVGELAADLPVSRPAVSQHLKVLKDAGLVAEQAVGTRRIYRLNEAGVAALRDQLDAFWNRALSGFQDLAEQPPQEKP